MFGLVRPCLHHTTPSLHAAWLSHLCGMCLTLRDEHGHPYRLATNFDGLLVSVLVAAQAPPLATTRTAAPCALRGFRRTEVLTAKATGTRLAAAVSLILAAARMRDHVADRDGPYGRQLVARTVSRLADRWAGAGADTATAVGFDTAVLTDAVARQPALEAATRPGMSPLTVTEPTETAVAAAFGYTATLAGRPRNEVPLAAAGRAFGRLAHLLDAVEDLAADRATGVWNPLLATGTGVTEARKLCSASHRELRQAVATADFADAELVRMLLVDEVGRAIRRTFHAAQLPVGHGPPAEPPEPGTEGGEPDEDSRHRTTGRRALWWGLGTAAFGCAAAALTCGLWRPGCSRGHCGSDGGGGSGPDCNGTCGSCNCGGCGCGGDGGSDPSGAICTGCSGCCDKGCGCGDVCGAVCDGCCDGCNAGCDGCCTGCGEGCSACGDGCSCTCQ